jgi:hypothetical protein
MLSEETPCAPPDLLAPVPARQYHDKRAEQPITAENQRLIRTTGPTTLRPARLKSLSLIVT